MRAGWYAHGGGCAREDGGNGDGSSKRWPSYRRPVREVVWWLWGGTSSNAGLHGGNDVTNTDPDRFITSEMSVPVLPNTSSSYSRPSLPLPSSDCYHPTQQGRSVAYGTTPPLAEIGLSPRINRTATIRFSLTESITTRITIAGRSSREGPVL